MAVGTTGLAAPAKYVAYERVSTARQGSSGLGLEAQRQTIEAFATSRAANLIGRFTEIESGRNPDRPELAQALHLAKVTGATLVIAKLDRRMRRPRPIWISLAGWLSVRPAGVFAFVSAQNELTGDSRMSSL